MLYDNNFLGFKILKYNVNIFKYYIPNTIISTIIFINWLPIKAIHFQLKFFTTEI